MKYTKDVNLTSKEWCDIVFRGKNKRYGAYDLRRTSSSRHGLALIVVIVMVIVPLVPSVINRLANETIESKKEQTQEVKVVEVDLRTPPKEEKKAQPVKYYQQIELQQPMMQMVDVKIMKEGSADSKNDSKKDKGEDLFMDDSHVKFNSKLKDAKGTDAQKLYDEVDRINRELAEGRTRYEIGQQELAAAGRRGSAGGAGSGKSTGSSKNDDAKTNKNKRNEISQGNVLVEFQLDGRDKVYLHVPAYQCQYAGVVVVVITVNRNGRVVSANIDRSTSSSDDCIISMAVQSAMASTFTPSSSAPDKQKGTIKYTFLAQ